MDNTSFLGLSQAGIDEVDKKMKFVDYRTQLNGLNGDMKKIDDFASTIDGRVTQDRKDWIQADTAIGTLVQGNTNSIQDMGTLTETLLKTKYDDVVLTGTNLSFRADGKEKKFITLPTSDTSALEVRVGKNEGEIVTLNNDVGLLKTTKIDDIALTNQNSTLSFSADGVAIKSIVLPKPDLTQMETNKTDIASLKAGKYDDVNLTGQVLAFKANGVDKKSITLPTQDITQMNTNKTDIATLKGSKYDDVTLTGQNLVFKANGADKKTITLPTTNLSGVEGRLTTVEGSLTALEGRVGVLEGAGGASVASAQLDVPQMDFVPLSRAKSPTELEANMNNLITALQKSGLMKTE